MSLSKIKSSAFLLHYGYVYKINQNSILTLIEYTIYEDKYQIETHDKLFGLISDALEKLFRDKEDYKHIYNKSKIARALHEFIVDDFNDTKNMAQTYANVSDVINLMRKNPFGYSFNTKGYILRSKLALAIVNATEPDYTLNRQFYAGFKLNGAYADMYLLRFTDADHSLSAAIRYNENKDEYVPYNIDFKDIINNLPHTTNAVGIFELNSAYDCKNVYLPVDKTVLTYIHALLLRYNHQGSTLVANILINTLDVIRKIEEGELKCDNNTFEIVDIIHKRVIRKNEDLISSTESTNYYTDEAMELIKNYTKSFYKSN